MARSGLGSTQGAVRWNRLSRATLGCICGTNWMALAPVPITATRLFCSSTLWSQRCEWNWAP